jgi:hypothetical protein
MSSNAYWNTSCNTNDVLSAGLFEQGMHRQRDVVDEGDPIRRIDGVHIEWVRDCVEHIARMPPARAQAVEAQPRGNDNQPTLGIIDRVDVDAGQTRERFLHDVFGVAEVEQDAKGEIEHPAPVRLPQRGEDRRVSRRSQRIEWFRGVPHRYAFLRMPSCQINLSIDGLALGVATAIVARA